MYSVHGYGRMIADRPRMEAYAAALAAVVRPGAVVADVGAGTGIFSLIACRLGARKVYAIEPSDGVRIGREIAAANGFADRIEWIQKLSTGAELPERANVIVSDLRGVLPLFKRHLPAILDARARLLAPGGALVPRRDTLFAAVVQAPKLHADALDPWEGNDQGFDLTAMRRSLAHAWGRQTVRAEHLVTEGVAWTALDYATLESPHARGAAGWTVPRDATGHGLAMWFDTELAEGIGFSTAPGEHDPVYGRAFFPWPEAVDLRAGDRVHADLRADLVGDDYVWTWATRVERRDGGEPAAFHQSTFFGDVVTAQRLHRRSHLNHVELRAEGRADLLALEEMAKGAALGDVAARLHERFPERFPRWEDALTHAGALAEEYGE